jgi:hypothetical protein
VSGAVRGGNAQSDVAKASAPLFRQGGRKMALDAYDERRGDPELRDGEARSRIGHDRCVKASEGRGSAEVISHLHSAARVLALVPASCLSIDHCVWTSGAGSTSRMAAEVDRGDRFQGGRRDAEVGEGEGARAHDVVLLHERHLVARDRASGQDRFVRSGLVAPVRLTDRGAQECTSPENCDRAVARPREVPDVARDENLSPAGERGGEVDLVVGIVQTEGVPGSTMDREPSRASKRTARCFRS